MKQANTTVTTSGIIAIIAGILIIAVPAILQWVVGLWLIINGALKLAK